MSSCGLHAKYLPAAAPAGECWSLYSKPGETARAESLLERERERERETVIWPADHVSKVSVSPGFLVDVSGRTRRREERSVTAIDSRGHQRPTHLHQPVPTNKGAATAETELM